MIAELVLGALLLAAQSGGVTARLVPDPAEVEIGEPVEWILDVAHPASARVRPIAKPDAAPAKAAAGAPSPPSVPKTPAKPAAPTSTSDATDAAASVDRAWVTLGETTWTRTIDPADPTRARTIARFQAIALEGGDLRAPAMALELVDGASTTALAPESLPVHVRSALAEGEDVPRPMLGFRDVPADLGPARRGPWVLAALAALAALVVAAVATWLVARRKRAVVVAPPTPLARLDELARGFAGGSSGPGESREPGDARATVYALSRLVRESVDAFVGVDRSGEVDEAWSAALASDARVPAAVRDASARLLASAERVKYARETPTRFAVDELLADARRALEALASAPPPVAPSSKDASDANGEARAA